MSIRDSIIEKTKEIFSEKGVKATKLQDIASALKISKKTIYKHFASKDDLIVSIFVDLTKHLNAQSDRLAQSSESTINKFIGIIRIIIDNMAFLTPKLVEELKGEPYGALKKVLDEFIQRSVFQRFTFIIQNGKKEGSISKEVKTETLVVMYKDAIMNFVFMRSMIDTPGEFSASSPLQNFCDTLATIFRGVLVPQAENEFDQAYKKIVF